MSDSPSDQPTATPGGQPSNVNRVVHGGRSQRFGIVFSKLGKRFASQYGDCCRFRREVERLVVAQYGSLSLRRRARTQTLIRLEMSCRACELLIRDTPDMAADEVRQNRSQIVHWSRERDNVLAELLGDGTGVTGEASVINPWDALPANPQQAPEDAPQSDPAGQGDSEDIEATTDAADGESHDGGQDA